MVIRVVILGSGASIPTVERNLSAVALRFAGDVYLFDCGEGTQRQMMRYKISYARVKCIFLTHLHPDHVLGITGLVHTLDFGTERKEPLFIYGPRGTERRMSELIGAKGANFVRVQDVDENFELKEKEFTVRAFPVEHVHGSMGYVFEENERRKFDKEKADKLGIKGRMFSELEGKGEVKVKGKTIKIEDVTWLKKGKKIVYTGDAVYGKETVKASKEADLLIHDATFTEEMREEAEKKRHATAGDAARVAKEAKVARLILTHISNRYADAKEIEKLEKEAKKIFANSEVAKDGLEVIIDSSS
ncbi:MAG: ribonuclease Z [Candidatus Micrarchaeota archaeon]